MGLSDKKQESRGTTTSSGTTTGTSSGTSTTSVPDTPDIIAARGYKPRIDPSIGFRLAEKERQLEDSMVSPTGGYVTPQIRDAILRSGRRDLMQQAGQQVREGVFDQNRLDQTNKLALAGLTRGSTTSDTRTGTTTGTTTGTSAGTVTQSESPWGTIAGVGASVAPLSL